MGVVTRTQSRRKLHHSDGEEPPPRCRRGAGGPDLISLLPDEVLCSVISLLPTNEGARTQILSSRWRPLWRSAPLNLDASDIGETRKAVIVSRILSEHQGVGRRFNISPFILAVNPAKLDVWLRSPALDNLQELDFGFHPSISPRPLIPCSALRFSSTLRVAGFSYCRFPDDAAHQFHFPNLQHLALASATISENSLHAMLVGCPVLDKFKLMNIFDSSPRPQVPPSALHFSSTLRFAEFASCQFPEIMGNQVHFPNIQSLLLETVTISEGSLHAMLYGCPALNSLMLGYCTGFRQFRINSLKLEHVEMYFRRSDAVRIQKLIVENAPCLERLHHHGPYKDNIHFSIISAPKLKILGRLTANISWLELGTTVLKGLHVVRMATVMRSVKVLALRADILLLDVIINFMTCFPCMEKLYIKTRGIVLKNMEHHYSQDPIECLDHHLKKLRIGYYSGQRFHIEFVKFFVLNASVLESLVLDVDPYKKESDRWIENQRVQLQLEKRASIGAQIDFNFGGSFSYLSDF